MAADIAVPGGCARVLVRDLENGKDFTVNNTTLRHLIMNSTYGVPGKPNIGINIPTAELRFSIPDYTDALKLFQSKNTEVEIQIASSPEKFSGFKYKYKIVNLDIDLEDLPVVTLYMIYDLGKFMNEIKQKSFKDMSFMELVRNAPETIEHIEFIDKTEGLETEDKMTWLRAGTSEYQFLSDSCKFINSQDLVLIAPAVDPSSPSKLKLKVVSYDKEIQKSPQVGIILGADNRANAGYPFVVEANKFRYETSRGVYDYMIGSENYTPVLRLPAQEVEEESIFTSWFKSLVKAKEPPADEVVTRPMPVKLDMGNTHEKFWESRTANEKKMLGIYQNILYAETSSTFIENEVQVLDSVRLINDFQGRKTSVMNSNFIILGVSKYISVNKFGCQLILGVGTK